MELIVSQNGFKIQCAGCLVKTKISEVKKIGKKYYCRSCQDYIIKSLKDEKGSETNSGD